MAVGFFGKQLLKNLIKGGKQKTTGTEVIKSVKPNVPKNKSEKLKSQLKIATQKSKASQAKLDNTIFRIEQQKKRLQEKKAKGGRVGLKLGTKKKSNIDKIKKTFGTLSVRAGIDKNPNPTYADKIAGAKMKNKNKKKII